MPQLPEVRIVVPAAGTYGSLEISATTSSYPAKEFSISDDVLNISDCASVVIANDRGAYSRRFSPGMLIQIDERHDDVNKGDWCRQFTGRITAIEDFSDDHGGSNLMLTAMDLGWHLTSSHAEPMRSIKNVTFRRLLETLLDPSWGITQIDAGNALNRRIKHGRQVIMQEHKPVLGAVLPYIQTEPGQSPIDLLQTYAAREGLLVNVGAKGNLIFFRPDYQQQSMYSVEFHDVTDSRHTGNNVIGRPSVSQSIDGLYSEVQCWSTVVIPPEIANSENPNEMYRHSRFTPSVNPLPFTRRCVFADGEAINDKLRKNRAQWKFQMGGFQSWRMEVEIPSHTQLDAHGKGAFFTSDTMISVNDSYHGVSGSYYVQSVRRSLTLGGGTRTRLTIRQPVIDPKLTALPDPKRR